MALDLNEIKSGVEHVGKAFEEFKATEAQARKEQDVLLTDKLSRLAEDITAKHAAFIERINAMEARGQKPAASEGSAKAEANAELFAKTRRDLQAGIRSGGDYTPNVEQCEKYSKAFNQYMRVDKDGMDMDVRKDLSVGSDPDGGYWAVPPTIAQNVVRRVFETSPMRQVASVMTIGTREYVIPEDPNDVGAGWVAERGPITTTSTMQVQRRTITAQEIYAQPAITTQMLEDSMIDIEAYLASKLSDKLARVQNTAFILGDGVGKPRGILTYPAGTNWGTQIEQIGTGTSGAFTYTGLMNLIVSIKDKYQAAAEFLVRRQAVASIMLLTDGNSRLIFQPILNGAFNQTPLLGYKMNYAADVPAVGAGALALAFGDFKSGYQIVDRVGFSTIRDNLTAKPNVLFYTRARVGGDVIDFDAIKVQVLT